MSKVYKIHTLDFKMRETYKRISLGIYFDKNLYPYPKEFLIKLIDYFSGLEEYEKCIKIKEMIKVRFNHELNYKDIIK